MRPTKNSPVMSRGSVVWTSIIGGRAAHDVKKSILGINMVMRYANERCVVIQNGSFVIDTPPRFKPGVLRSLIPYN